MPPIRGIQMFVGRAIWQCFRVKSNLKRSVNALKIKSALSTFVEAVLKLQASNLDSVSRGVRIGKRKAS